MLRGFFTICALAGISKSNMPEIMLTPVLTFDNEIENVSPSDVFSNAFLNKNDESTLSIISEYLFSLFFSLIV